MAPPVPLKSKNTRSTGTGTTVNATPTTAKKGTTTATAPGKGSSFTAATKGTTTSTTKTVGVGVSTTTAGAIVTKKAPSVSVNGPKKEVGLSSKAPSPASPTTGKKNAATPVLTPGSPGAGGTKGKDNEDVMNGNEPNPPPPTFDNNANEVTPTDSSSSPPEKPILAPLPSAALLLPVAENGKKDEVVVTKKAKEEKPTEEVAKLEPKATSVVKKSTTTTASVASGSGPSTTNKSAYVPPRSRSKGVAAPPTTKTGISGTGAVSKAAPVSTSASTKTGASSAPPKPAKQANGSGAATKTGTTAATTLKKGVLKVPPPPPIGHPLHSTWTFWYQNTKHNTSWEDSFKQIHTFGMAESFWTLHEKVRSPSELGAGSSYYLFKNGIFPAWENEHNRSGGRWIVMTEVRHRGWLDAVWLEVMMLLIGEGFGQDGDEICGAGLDIRGKGDKIAIWTGDYTKEDAILNIGRKIQNCIQAVPNFYPRQRMTYEVHEDPEPGYRSTHARERGGDKNQRCLHSLEFVGRFP